MADDDAGMTPVGINLPPDLIEELDDLKREWDAREAGTVHRSEVAREALALGLIALKQLDEPEYMRLPTQERRAILRQAIIDMKTAGQDGDE